MEYLVEDTQLEGIADAIRQKGGTGAPLSFPDEFVSAIGAIQIGTDVSDTTATAGDVLAGTYFYTSAGVKTQGNLVIQHYYTGGTAPSSSLGEDGDIYLQT